MTISGWKSSSVCWWAIATVAACWWGIMPSHAIAEDNTRAIVNTNDSILRQVPIASPLQERNEGINRETKKLKEERGDVIPITAVKTNPTEKGIEIILETTLGEQLQIVNRTKGDRFIADIPNAQLRSLSGKTFTFNSSQPSEGITQITVTNLDDKTVRVTITGETSLPSIELFDSPEGLILNASAIISQTTPLIPPLQGGNEGGQITPVTGVQLNPTQTGIELLLQTPTGSAEQLQPNNISSGNNFMADIPNAQLQLPSGKPFRAENPIAGINEVTVNNQNPNTIRVTAVGETAIPQVELFDSDEGLIFGLTPSESSAQTPSTQPEGSQEGQIATINRVRLNPTETGFEIVLLTPTGVAQQLRVVNISQGNNFIAQISNAQINLPDDKPFKQENPIEGVSEVTVTNQDENTVLVTVVGENRPPTVELFDSEDGLIFSAISEEQTAQEEDIELVVTGEQDGYRVPNASTATRTDTPIRDIPQSIQVVPQEVIEDRNVRTVFEAVETVSGVLDGSSNYGAPGGTFIIRGFTSFDSGNLRNGFRDYDYYSVSSIGTIEQVEVLKGPASVLFSAQEPGGVINTVTKKPLSEPYYNVAFEAGNYGFYQPSIDLSGPLITETDRNVLYRFIASYQGAGSYQDFGDSSITTIAPSITLKLGDRTDLNLSYEYVRYFADNPQFEVPLLSDGSLPPRNFYPAYPDLVLSEIVTNRIGYTLNHKFNENWQIRNNLAVVLNQRVLDRTLFGTLVDDRILTGAQADESSSWADNYFGQIDLLGKFNTGSVSHQILVGFDANYFESLYKESNGPIPDLDIFNPNYDVPRPDYIPNPEREFYTLNKSYGIYLQDQIAFSDNWKLLIGGRYDWSSTRSEIDGPFQDDGAFSPRIGLVYQPSNTVSLYASYSSSFKPSIGLNPDERAFEPTRGTQYEVGVKTDFLDRKLSATLAAYHLTKTNVTTPNPDPILAAQGFSIQTGEVRSQGIELDIAGEILPGWKIIASYAYTDAEVTEDNVTPVGNQLDNVPFNQASLWTTYEIQKGDLRGLGFGLGLFYIGERQGDLANSFELPSHLRTDAALYYRRGGFNAAINIRNLFDIDYANYSFGRNIIQRSAPFTITGSIGWTF